MIAGSWLLTSSARYTLPVAALFTKPLIWNRLPKMAPAIFVAAGRGALTAIGDSARRKASPSYGQTAQSSSTVRWQRGQSMLSSVLRRGGHVGRGDPAKGLFAARLRCASNDIQPVARRIRRHEIRNR